MLLRLQVVQLLIDLELLVSLHRHQVFNLEPQLIQVYVNRAVLLLLLCVVRGTAIISQIVDPCWSLIEKVHGRSPIFIDVSFFLELR